MPSFLDTAASFVRGAAQGGLQALVRSDSGQQEMGGDKSQTSSKNPVMPTETANEDPKAIQFDPYQVLAQMGYRDRPSPIGYNTLQAMVYRSPIISSVLQTRINQVAAFAHPQSNRFGSGFVVRLRDRNARLTPAARKFCSQMEGFYSNTGVTDNPRGRDNFNTYLRKEARDTLIYDAHATEIVPNKKGLPCEFYAVDASTIRLAQSAKAHMDEDLEDETRYVQIYDGTIIAEFTQNELCYGVRNPNTNIRLQGYGTSELEMLVETVTNLVNGFDYNARYFTQNSAPKGLINIKAGMSEKMLSKFKNQWYAMLSGVENAWRTPITNAEAGIEWINMQQSNQEMGFQAWIDLLIKCTCSVYCISPDEIGHPYGNAGQTSTLSQGSNRDKIIESRERGLRPLLSHLAHSINTHIMWPIHEDFKFEFVGLDAMTREQLAELNSKRVRSSWTVNEIRAEEDLPPLPDGKGDIILDPTWLQNTMAAQQQQQMGSYGGDNVHQDDSGAGDGDDENDREYADEQQDKDDDNGGDKQLTRALTRLSLPGTQTIDIVRKARTQAPLLKIKL
jgi:hypothetical protein